MGMLESLFLTRPFEEGLCVAPGHAQSSTLDRTAEG